MKGATAPPQREPDGAFANFDDWVTRATRAIGGTNAACFDAKDRRCLCGADFMRARDEGAFPVRYWHGEGGQTAREQARSARLADDALHFYRPPRLRRALRRMAS